MVDLSSSQTVNVYQRVVDVIVVRFSKLPEGHYGPYISWSIQFFDNWMVTLW